MRVEEEDRLRTSAVSVRDATRAEITKGLTQPVIPLVCLVVLVINTALFTLASTELVRLSAGGGLINLSEMGAVMLAPVYVFLIIPAWLAGSEYVDGQLRVTLAAVPDRGRLIAGKLAAAVALVVPGTVIVLLPGRVILAVSKDMSLPAALSDLARWTAAYTLLSFVAYSLAVLVRSRVAPVAILALIPPADCDRSLPVRQHRQVAPRSARPELGRHSWIRCHRAHPGSCSGPAKRLGADSGCDAVVGLFGAG